MRAQQYVRSAAMFIFMRAHAAATWYVTNSMHALTSRPSYLYILAYIRKGMNPLGTDLPYFVVVVVVVVMAASWSLSKGGALWWVVLPFQFCDQQWFGTLDCSDEADASSVSGLSTDLWCCGGGVMLSPPQLPPARWRVYGTFPS